VPEVKMKGASRRALKAARWGDEENEGWEWGCAVQEVNGDAGEMCDVAGREPPAALRRGRPGRVRRARAGGDRMGPLLNM